MSTHVPPQNTRSPFVSGNKKAVSGNRRLTVHDISKEDGPHVFVLNTASRVYKTQTLILINHTYTSGQTTVLEVPPTFIPYDVTQFVPKDEILANPFFMSNVARGYLELVATPEALAILETPEAIVELDRVRASLERRFPEAASDNDFKQVNAAGQTLEGTLGDVDPLTVGISPSVVEVLAREDIDDAERHAIFRNLRDTLTKADIEFVNKTTQDPTIQAIVNRP